MLELLLRAEGPVCQVSTTGGRPGWSPVCMCMQEKAGGTPIEAHLCTAVRVLRPSGA
jgi:hypothetical protein